MKKLFILFLLSGKLISQDITSNLVICMPMDGNAQDISGNNNHGVTTSVVAAPDRFNNLNSALQFNGNPSQVVVPASPSINNIETLSELTITCWCKILSFSPTNCFPIANKHKTANDWGWDYTVQPPATWNGQILVPDFFGMGGNYAICKGNEGVTTNQWDFYAITFSKSNSTFRVYKNTTLLNTVNTSTYSLEATANGSLYVGCSPASTDDYANGLMDDFKMYARALTQAEILLIYNGGSCVCSAPAAPVEIFGENTVCQNSTNVFSVNPVPGATSYSWNLPGGWTGSSASNTISITSALNSGTISVAATNSCGVSAFTTLSITVIPCGPSGWKEKAAIELNLLIYPNPNNGNFFIDYKNNSKKLKVSVLNLLGQEIYSSVLKNNNKNEIKISGNKGLYILRFYDAENNFVSQKKVVIDQ